MSGSESACVSCVVMVKDPKVPLLKLSLRSVCKAACVKEVIVVTPRVEELTWVRDLCPKVKLVRDPGWGIGIARNLGVRNSSCEIVAFVDPDAIVGKDHFCEVLKAFEDQSVGLVNVSSVIDERLSRVLTKVQRLENLVWKHGRVARFEREGYMIYAGGTFMALRKSVWREVGGFWRYPPYGSDDMDFSYRVYRSGYKCRSIRVKGSFHLPRATLTELFREQYGWGRGFAILMLKYLSDREFWLSLRYSKLVYRLVPSSLWFLIPILRVLAAPLGGLINSIKWREPEFLPYWVFRRYAFLLGFIKGLYDYSRLKTLLRKRASLCAKTFHS